MLKLKNYFVFILSLLKSFLFWQKIYRVSKGQSINQFFLAKAIGFKGIIICRQEHLELHRGTLPLICLSNPWRGVRACSWPHAHLNINQRTPGHTWYFLYWQKWLNWKFFQTKEHWKTPQKISQNNVCGSARTLTYNNQTDFLLRTLLNWKWQKWQNALELSCFSICLTLSIVVKLFSRLPCKLLILSPVHCSVFIALARSCREQPKWRTQNTKRLCIICV